MSDHTDLHPDISWPFTNLKYVTQQNLQSTVTYLLHLAYVFRCYIITSVSLKFLCNLFNCSQKPQIIYRLNLEGHQCSVIQSKLNGLVSALNSRTGFEAWHLLRTKPGGSLPPWSSVFLYIIVE